jgi:hypothetical protein
MILWQDRWGGNLGKAQKLLVILIGHFRRLVASLIRRAVGVSARRSGLTSRLLDTDCDDGRIEAPALTSQRGNRVFLALHGLMRGVSASRSSPLLVTPECQVL